jgi:glycosyltransferase involved in cell wall biosynthesis
MISVLYLITSTTVGGTERSLFEICRRLDRQAFSPTVVSLKAEGPVAAEIRNLGVEVLSLGMRESADWLSVPEFVLGIHRLPRLLRGRKFDVLHSFLYRANLLGRFTAGRCGIAKQVASFRGTLEEPKGWMVALDRRTAARTDIFCTLSESLARELRERLGVAGERVAVIPNGIDLAAADRALAAARPAARERFGLSPADFVVGTVGRLHREKNLDLLLDAFRTFSLDHPRGTLLIAGDGPERSSLPARAEELRIAGKVRFLGVVRHPWEVLAAADLFALSSRYEGMPNVILEAMAASLPVVATAVGAVPEMIEDGREGLLVPPGDSGSFAAALHRLARNGDLRRVMGARGRERAGKHFRSEETVAALEGLYRSLVSERGP